MTILAWFGTVCSILGSFMVAMALFNLGYILFFLGSVSWLIVALTRKDVSLAVLNGTFLLANILGIYNFILR
jgi:hypothetical protein